MGALIFRFSMLIMLLPSLGQAGVTGPADRVEAVVDQVMMVLKDRSLDGVERRERINDLIQPHFDFDAMSRSILAGGWRRASSQQRRQFVALFTRMLKNTYVVAMESYSGQRVRIKNERLRGKRALVETLIEKDTGSPTSVNYRLVRHSDGWQAYDVVIGGVSLVSNYRSTFRAVVRREGMDGLLRQMAKKLEKE